MSTSASCGSEIRSLPSFNLSTIYHPMLCTSIKFQYKFYNGTFFFSTAEEQQVQRSSGWISLRLSPSFAIGSGPSLLHNPSRSALLSRHMMGPVSGDERERPFVFGDSSGVTAGFPPSSLESRARKGVIESPPMLWNFVRLFFPCARQGGGALTRASYISSSRRSD